MVFRPDSRGIITQTKQVIRTGEITKIYTQPTNQLNKINTLINQERPLELLFQRKCGGIGDVLCTLPLVKYVSKKYNNKIDYATDVNYLNGALVDVLKYNPYIRDVFDFRELDLFDNKYDTILDLTCPCVAHEKPGAKPMHRIDLFARHTGVSLTDCDIDYFITKEEEKHAYEYIYRNNLLRYEKKILLHVASSNLQRDCPINILLRSMSDLLKLNEDVLVFVLSHDTDNNQNNINLFTHPHVHKLHNLNIRNIAAFMNVCDLVICPDSSILHLAAALHKKTLTIFGPTDPRARINYHPEAVSIWSGKELKQYPLWYENSGPNGYICWKIIEHDTITKTAHALLNNKVIPYNRHLVHFGDYDIENELYQIL